MENQKARRSVTEILLGWGNKELKMQWQGKRKESFLVQPKRLESLRNLGTKGSTKKGIL